MNKMVVNRVGKLFVTNDASTIIQEMEVMHPAAKMIVLASKQQEQEIGDMTNTVVILAGEFLQQAEALLRMGLHVNDVVTGYTAATEKALEIILDLEAEKVSDVRDKEQAIRFIKSSIASKQYGREDILARVIVDACQQVMPENPTGFNVDNVRCGKILGGGVTDTSVTKGFVLSKDAHGTIKHAKDAKVAVVACGLEMAKTETKGTVLIKTAKDLKDFSTGEEDLMEKCIQEISEAGVSVVVSGGGVSDLALHYCEKFNIMVVKEASKFQLRRLCKATGCRPLTRLGKPMPEEIGHCTEVSVEEIGSTKVVVFRSSVDSGVSTVLIRGSTQNILDDVERCVDDAVNSFKLMVRDPRMVAGAGAFEIELARRLTPFADSVPGLDQYAFKRYAEALEVIPRTIAENAGFDGSGMISSLYASHEAGNVFDGIDINTGKVTSAKELGVLDSLLGRYYALKLAADAAITILRVDQIIMAKPAGGPKAPSQQMGPRDF
eukprot:TRINITY_DN2046_c0_g1_i8.p1 TRINITY_DN2046_c0_g1~~TRINITY_DN2046_c0_g1_i8.p1  ORF type:complete len:556 (-),score=181.92 TRINITY_DN2046_c0_g1_i8:3680-5158(-)